MKPKPLPAKRRAVNDEDPLVVAARRFGLSDARDRTTKFADAVADEMIGADNAADCAAFVMGALWERRQPPTPARSARRSRK